MSMNDDHIKVLDKAARKAKRIASERASELHDLVEDRLPAAYAEIPGIAQACYEACRAWAEAEAALKAAASETA